MRKFYDGNGNDSSAAVQAYLATHRQFEFADFYIVNTAPQYSGQYLGQTFLLTDYPSPLVWNYKGTFKPAVISRGEVESKVGLESQTLEVKWGPQDSNVLATDGSGNTLLTVLQGFLAGIFDQGVLEVWRCLMPASAALLAGVPQQPTGLTATAASGGVLANGNYYIRATALNAIGESIASSAAVIALSGTNGTIDATLTSVPGATSYRFYYGTQLGLEDLYVTSATASAVIDGTQAAVGEYPRRPGDCNTFGACCMFGGRIGKLQPDRLNAKISVASRLETLNVQVPTNTIQPGGIAAQYAPGVTPTGGLSSAAVASGSTTAKILASGGTPKADLYDNGYLVFKTGKLAGHYAAIAWQAIEGGNWAFHLQTPLPFAAAVGDSFVGYTSLASSPEFPYAPVPINSAMLIG